MSIKNGKEKSVYLKVNINKFFTLYCVQSWLNFFSIYGGQVYIICEKNDIISEIRKNLFFGNLPLREYERLREKQCDPLFVESDFEKLTKFVEKIVVPHWVNAAVSHLTCFLHAKENGYNNFWNIDADDTIFISPSFKLLKEAFIKVENISHCCDCISLDMWNSQSNGFHWSFGVAYLKTNWDWKSILESNIDIIHSFWDNIKLSRNIRNIDHAFTALAQKHVIKALTFYIEHAIFCHYGLFLDKKFMYPGSSINYWADGEIIYPMINIRKPIAPSAIKIYLNTSLPLPPDLPRGSAPTVIPNITSSTSEDEDRTSGIAMECHKTVTVAGRAVAGDISDCKIINYWFATNYGAVLSCYALQETLFSLGKSAKVVNFMPNHWRQNYTNSFSAEFSRRHLHLTRCLWDQEDLKPLNDVTDSFIVGPDQVFRPDLYTSHGGSVFQLDFVRADRRRIACSASFGKLTYEVPSDEASRFQYNLAQFDAISVSEIPGIAIFDKMGITSTQIIDPVFYLSRQIWHRLANSHSSKHEKCVLYFSLPYIKAIQLPPILDIASAALRIPVHVQQFDLQRSVEDWLDAIREASFVVTDSFYGMCFAILFHRPFVVLGVYRDVRSRMNEVLGVLGLETRIIDPGKLEGLESLFAPIDWGRVDEIIELEKKRALTWLKNALEKPVQRKEFAGPRLDRLDGDISRLNSDQAIVVNRYQIIAKYYISKILKKFTFGQCKTRNTERFNKYNRLLIRLHELKKIVC